MKLIAIATCAVVCLSSSRLDAAEPTPPPPVVEEALRYLEDGNYASCLHKISRQLASSNEARPGTADRYELLMLRGECLLRMRQPAPARAAYESAATCMKTRRDIARVATATAMAALVKASPDLSYAPKAGAGVAAGGSAPIDIIDPDSRQRALKALYDDSAAEMAPVYGAAVTEKSLRPINALLPRAWELYSLEYATTGDAVLTVTYLKELGTHARTLLRGEIDRLASRVNELQDLAAEPMADAKVENQGGGSGSSVELRGLKEEERGELLKITEQMGELQRFAHTGRRIGRMLGAPGESWDVLLADCADARHAAQKAQEAQTASR